VLVYHFTSFEQGKLGRKSGIPAQVQFGGVPFTLRAPHDCTPNDFEVFDEDVVVVAPSSSSGKRSSGGGGGKTHSKKDIKLTSDVESPPNSDNTSNKQKEEEEEKRFKIKKNVNQSAQKKKFPNELFFAVSVPVRLLEPLRGFEHDEGLCMISTPVINALRPSEFVRVVDGKPWIDNMILLQPGNILRSFLIMEADTKPIIHFDNHNNNHNNNLSSSYSRDVFEFDDTFYSDHHSNITLISDVDVYTDRMTYIRKEATKKGLVPLYHYTSPVVAPMIMSGGLRMSTQGQGDGGVYVSTQGPASYDLGSPEYEVNIIKDCFGVERVNEYVGKGNLDVIIVYGCTAAMLEQVSATQSLTHTHTH
jgi:hypothetical protein